MPTTSTPKRFATEHEPDTVFSCGCVIYDDGKAKCCPGHFRRVLALRGIPDYKSQSRIVKRSGQPRP